MSDTSSVTPSSPPSAFIDRQVQDLKRAVMRRQPRLQAPFTTWKPRSGCAPKPASPRPAPPTRPIRWPAAPRRHSATRSTSLDLPCTSNLETIDKLPLPCGFAAVSRRGERRSRSTVKKPCTEPQGKSQLLTPSESSSALKASSSWGEIATLSFSPVGRRATNHLW